MKGQIACEGEIDRNGTTALGREETPEIEA